MAKVEEDIEVDQDLEIVPTTGTALYLPGEAGYVAPAKYQQIMATLPASHPALNQILDRFTELRVKYKRSKTPLPGALGGNTSTSPHNNEFHMVEGRLDSTLIYDCGFYTKTEIDLRYEQDADFREQLHRAMQRGHLTVNGSIAQYNFEPILVVERPEDPDEIGGKCYAILGGWIYWQIALNTQAKWVEGLVFGDMPNYHIRDISLRLAGVRSAPPVWEMVRQFIHMREEYNQGERAVGAEEHQPPPGIASAEEIVPCSAGYRSKIRLVVNDIDAGPVIEQHLLPPASVYPIVAKLRNDRETLKVTLDRAVAEGWSQTRSEEYVDALLRDRRAPKSSPFAVLEAKVVEVRLLLADRDTLLERFSDDQLKRIDTIAAQLLKEIKAALS